MEFKALIIDDDEASRKLVRFLMEKMGCKASEAADGEMGSLSLLNERQNILVLDWRMPKLDGADTLLMVDSILQQIAHPIQESPISTILYTSVPLQELRLPNTKYFRVKGYVFKKWSVGLQSKYFRKITKAIYKEAR